MVVVRVLEFCKISNTQIDLVHNAQSSVGIRHFIHHSTHILLILTANNVILHEEVE
jgi:hypothetical protein